MTWILKRAAINGRWQKSLTMVVHLFMLEFQKKKKTRRRFRKWSRIVKKNVVVRLLNSLIARERWTNCSMEQLTRKSERGNVLSFHCLLHAFSLWNVGYRTIKLSKQGLANRVIKMKRSILCESNLEFQRREILSPCYFKMTYTSIMSV